MTGATQYPTVKQDYAAVAALLKAHGHLLDPKHADILARRLQDYTLIELGDTHGVTRERIRQIEAASIIKMYNQEHGVVKPPRKPREKKSDH